MGSLRSPCPFPFSTYLCFVFFFKFLYSYYCLANKYINKIAVLLCSMLLDKKFKSELARVSAESAVKLGTRSNRYETLLKQRHVQVYGIQAG